jgi:lipopolysaccharide export system permease protein
MSQGSNGLSVLLIIFSQLNRYLASAVLKGTFLVLIALIPLLSLFVLTDELDELKNSYYGVTELVMIIGLSLPRYLYEIFPIATLIGALTGLGTLASRSELVAMRAAGFSLRQIIFGALLAGGLLAIITLLLGEFGAPAAEHQLRAVQSYAKTGQTVQLTDSGFWARDGDYLMNIREVLPGARLRDIFIYELDKTRLHATWYAQQADYDQGRWMLYHIQRTYLLANRTVTESIDHMTWNSLLNPALLEIIAIEPRELCIRSLLSYLDFLQASHQDQNAYAVALWNKLIHPVFVLVMIFLAIPVLLATTRSRSLGLKIFIGIPFGIAFYVISHIFTYLALLYSFNPAIAAVMPLLLFTSLALWLIQRLN